MLLLEHVLVVRAHGHDVDAFFARGIVRRTRTTFGANVYHDYVANHSSTLTQRFLNAGLSIFGKTASPEWGLLPTTEPRLHGPTKNPWNLAHSAGGSSGGAAAVVAARIIPVAHASDGGGSIRIPASACGVFGMKPTRARNRSVPIAAKAEADFRSAMWSASACATAPL